MPIARWLATPVASASLLFAAVLCIAWVPSPSYSSWSDAGAFLHKLFSARSTMCRFDSATYVILRTRGGLEIKGQWDDSLGDAVVTLNRDPANAMTCFVIPQRTSRTGVWALTRESVWGRMTFDDTQGTFTLPEIALARSMIAADLLANGTIGAPWAARLGAGDPTDRRLLPGGYAQNALTLAVFVLLGLSLRWIPGAPARRRARRLGRAECPRCRYSLEGLGVARCPECGTSLTPAAPPPR